MSQLPKSIDLHAIRDEIRNVKQALSAVQPHSSPAKREDIDLKLFQLDELERATKKICPKTMDVWTQDDATHVSDGRQETATDPKRPGAR